MKHLKFLIIIIIGFLIFSCEKDSNSDNIETPIDDTISKLSDGYVLYSFMGDKTIHLIDTIGNDVKSWTSSFQTSGGSYLSKNNNLLRLGSTPEAKAGVFSSGGAVGGIIEELDDNSNVIWSVQKDSDDSTFHHDFKEVDENTIIALTWELLEYNGEEYWNENILLIDKTSNSVIWEWSAINDGGLIPNDNDKTDFLHFNSIDYKNGSILISSRSQNKLYLINKESKEITTTLSVNGTLSGQHDATLLDNGNILVFNNNAGNNKSEVLEITKLDELIWQYSNDFYSDHISGVYRLESGNTIICSGIEARIIEVSETGEEVWDYSPESTNTNKSSEIFKIRKYSSY
ncbi:arylsulfotransferase family protein [Algibacter sp. L4_22]|uniref:arylsulfotransferase family protein n=1 Tax=Algibacter sp. L4_22 TaxID=2942477 RepID=UPI00201B5AFA|nr:arylsulfotransferase family protein [Algibacter sp. L4_22]MCL5129896.1 aryl-sulfate sulfotransferase [Algibacter sp. L4_22]